jgi:uncharacterized protein YjbI with pentapeptide repeats
MSNEVIKILHRRSGKVLFETAASTRKEVVLAAIKSKAILSGADLSKADLSGADLSKAILSGADLSRVILSGADLSRVILYGANLSGADLSGASLYGVNLSGANLSWTNLSNIKNADLTFAHTLIVPESGPFVGWKKCKDGVLVKVGIPSSAKRSNANGRKCRASKVKVLEVIGAKVGVSSSGPRTEYHLGKIVECDKWEENRWIECGGGIHFFLTRIEAENYNWS